jgi:hypothetical protein
MTLTPSEQARFDEAQEAIKRASKPLWSERHNLAELRRINPEQADRTADAIAQGVNGNG